ncbi:MAG TPA: hypothetical protein VL098_01150 [Flavipsychrobacter sp.]|nr:hypothetical protein [Flavipsychrobacter sp.]
MQGTSKYEIIQQLQKEVLALQGHRKAQAVPKESIGLDMILKAFPENSFPIAVHEFLSNNSENAAATNGFISGLLSKLLPSYGVIVWVSMQQLTYPVGLKWFSLHPDRIVFINLTNSKQVLWTIEEALKCTSVAAVVGELSELSFKQSRRLQLAVEASHVTGFIHRHNPTSENTVACVTRWKIQPVASITEQGLPGLGFPRWKVQLLKVRNGQPATWEIEWSAGNFHVREQQSLSTTIYKIKTG